jgi:murein DD-endopeptidase MepM/ murein hydrolase activator NlpD
MVCRSAVPLVLLTSLLMGCTEFRPVDQDPGQSWVAAKREAYKEPVFSGKLHKVARGDTASTIAARYGVTLQQLAAVNGLSRPYVVRLGRNLKIPEAGGRQPAPVRERPRLDPAPPTMAPTPAEPEIQVASLPPAVGAIVTKPVQIDEPPAVVEEVRAPTPTASPGDLARASAKKPPGLSGDGFLWPASGTVVSRYGSKKDGTQNDGINIAAPSGAPVLAAENGIVSYADDEIQGWGRMVLIRHADGFTTGYAHLDAILTSVGDEVHRGQVIGRIGKTGYVDTPQLHFELRSGKRALDPSKLLVRQEDLRVASR